MPASPTTSTKAAALEHESLLQTLDGRHEHVSKMTKEFYNGDIVPPSTKSQVLRAQKFSVLYFYMVNCVIFLYAFFIPAHQSFPYYGGMNLKDGFSNSGHLAIAGLVLIMVGVRFLVTSWSTQFYQFALVLAASEGATLAFTMAWWSPGMPVILVMLVSNIVNITVSQAYWKNSFVTVIKQLPDLVPPAPLPCRDSTLSTLSFKNLFGDFKKLWGFDVYRPEFAIYEERCGVFGARDQIAHTQALHMAYMQAIEPGNNHANLWSHDQHMTNPSCLGVFEGWLRVSVCNSSFAFAGFWLGRVLFEDASGLRFPFAVGGAVLATLLYWGSIRWTGSRLDEALGVAVAEKEWLAFDVVRHTAMREELTIGALDTDAHVNAMDSTQQFGASAMVLGRQNLVFMWINAAATSSFIGESWLGRVFENVAIQTRLMMETMTGTDFRHWAEAKWEVIWMGSLTKAIQTFLLTLMTCLYFGQEYPKNNLAVEMPVPLMACLGAACFVQTVVSLAEALHLTAYILGKGEGTHRASYISEWAVGITVLTILTNILIWLYLLPIMKRWNIPIGGCKHFNKLLFPAACGYP